MPAVWFALKRSINCRSQQTEVHEPDTEGKKLTKISTKKPDRADRPGRSARSGCSRSIANLKDVVINGSKRHTEKPPICSPRSIGSSELLNPITHEVVLDDATCELKITAAAASGGGGGGDFVGVLKPGTPGPGGFYVGRGQKAALGSPVRRSTRRSGGSSRARSSFSTLSCPKCGDQFLRCEAVEAHFLAKHAVTKLGEGDSSRRIVEIICRTSSSRADGHRTGIERILKVHNMQKTLAQFEEYREIVKIKASKLPKKHPRCLADGNELLRFHGSTVECSLGARGSSALCSSEKCRVCRILRHGFFSKREGGGGPEVGVFTASTSSRAFEMIHVAVENAAARKALIVCRVVAGRVHRPLESGEEMVGKSGFDSLAGKVGVHSTIEELYLLSPRALLPCFVVIYKS